MQIPDRIDIHHHVHLDTGQQDDVAPPLLEMLKCGLAELSKSNAQLEILTAFLQRQGVKMTAIDDKVTALTASTQRIDDAVGSVQTFVQGIPALVQAAVDEAKAAGATPEQLAAFDDLNNRLNSDADKIVAALTTDSSGSAPATPPADGGTAPADGGTAPADGGTPTP